MTYLELVANVQDQLSDVGFHHKTDKIVNFQYDELLAIAWRFLVGFGHSIEADDVFRKVLEMKLLTEFQHFLIVHVILFVVTRIPSLRQLMVVILKQKIKILFCFVSIMLEMKLMIIT